GRRRGARRADRRRAAHGLAAGGDRTRRLGIRADGHRCRSGATTRDEPSGRLRRRRRAGRLRQAGRRGGRRGCAGRLGRARVSRGTAGPMTRGRLTFVVVLLAVPMAGLAVLLARPSTDVHWQHEPSHFWLVLVTAGVNAVLAYTTGVAARRRGDRRVHL